jgi:L-alanine-DL-glutamate epimerase-like enolase superfamily enzyme
MIKSITVSQEMVQLKEPFVTALRRVSAYPVVRVRVELETGNVGVGECVATPQISGDSFEEIWQELNSKKVSDLSEFTPEAIAELDLLNSSKAALDMAWWNLESNQSCSVRTDVTIPIAQLNDLPKIISDRKKAGFTAFKLKVDQDSIFNLLRRVELIRESAGENILIRIDPNQAWQLDYAVRATQELAKTGANIDYLEQPLHRFDLPGHKALAKESSIPLMADESCFALDDLRKVIESEAFKFLNVKILKAGGVVPALQLARKAQDAGLKVSIGSMMEGDTGIRAAIHMAHLIEPDAIHDLDAAWWIKDSEIEYQAGMVSS